MQKAFDGSDRFFPINYKTSWAIVRDVAKGSGGGGLVGTGGIGMALDSALNLFQWNRVATILLAIFAIVILAEVAVTFVRKRIL